MHFSFVQCLVQFWNAFSSEIARGLPRTSWRTAEDHSLRNIGLCSVPFLHTLRYCLGPDNFRGLKNARFTVCYVWVCGPRGLRRRSAVAWLLGSWVRKPLGTWMFVSCVYMLCCPVCVEAFATGWLLVQRSPTVCLNKITKPQCVRWPRSLQGL
jgi:hypothetical protein